MVTKKMLFPTDFTTHSIDALKEALALNKHLKFEITIFHAFSRPYSETKDYDHSLQLGKQERIISDKFEKLEHSISELKNHKYRFKKRLGYSVDAILEQISEDKPDLIIMNTKGAVGLGELWGTKTAKIIKSVDIPVIVLPTNTTFFNLNKIALACDYSEDTKLEKIEFLIKLAELNDLEIDIVTLNRQEKTMTREELANRDKVLQMMEHLKPKLAFSHHDDVKRGLIDYCQQNKVEMVSILPKSYNFIERAFHDSLTMSMAFHSPIPFLVLK
jgi:nucleotide-binding universal stress UspA family protein